MSVAALAACGDPAPLPQVTPYDHYVCVAGDTDVPTHEGLSGPFGDTGAIEATAAADETGSMVQDEGAPIYLAHPRNDDELEASRKVRGFRSTVACKPTPAPGVGDTWNHSQADAITYCFGAFGNAELEAAIRSAVSSTTWEYELAADINFVHIANLDGNNCNASSDVMFLIREGIDPGDCLVFGCPVAQAFFPSAAETGNVQKIIFFPELLNSNTFSSTGIVLHEFGHILGLHHEHARYVQQDGVLSFDQQVKCVLAAGTSNQWRGVTPPDPASIMGYPYCRGTPGGSVNLSSYDRLGLRYLYNLPALTQRSLDDDETDDILWYAPSSEMLTAWYGSGAPDNHIEFEVVDFCWDSALAPACQHPIPQNLKPLPLGTSSSTNVLMYGPGGAPDRLFFMPSVPGEPSRFNVSIQLTTAVPVVGDFAGEEGSDDALFVLPGPNNNDWGLANGSSAFQTYVLSEGAQGFSNAAVGYFVDRPDSSGDQILWYAENSPTWTLTVRNGGGIDEETVKPGACGLGTSSSLNAIVGNFDSDDLMEILWYDYIEETATLWTSIDNCTTNHLSYIVTGRPKPYPGDFDGDGRIDIAWDHPGSNDEIWRFTTENPIISSSTFPHDAAPAVGDFNGDGCADVLWHRPHTSSSPLWRSQCNGTFQSSNIETPRGATAVGYTFAHGRAYRP
jgi:hypothetical protein